MALAERVSHPFSMALAQLHCSYVHLFRREPDEVRRRVDKWIALSKEFGLSPTMMADGRFQLGWALAEEGHAAEGVREMREAIAAIAATGTAIGRQYLLCVLARACGESGEASEGLNLLERALDIARSGAKYQFPELLRAKGDLLLRLNRHDDAAENWLRQALMEARDEGTKSLELRAALSLARLYRTQQREREARDGLSPIYAWFTEGFATRDLVEAKDLLDQLR
jgi:predicted ATPase